MDREDILQRLDRLDMEAFSTINTPYKYRMIIVGGSGLVLLGVISRATQDIDALEAPNEIRHLLAKYDANLRVAAYVNNFPYNYDDRLVPLPVGGRKIQFYACSLEDIVIAKLCSPMDKDRQDLLSEEVLNNLDWDRLKHLALDEDEAKISAMNERRYQDFLYDYREYVRRYGPNEGIDV